MGLAQTLGLGKMIIIPKCWSLDVRFWVCKYTTWEGLWSGIRFSFSFVLLWKDIGICTNTFSYGFILFYYYFFFPYNYSILKLFENLIWSFFSTHIEFWSCNMKKWIHICEILIRSCYPPFKYITKWTICHISSMSGNILSLPNMITMLQEGLRVLGYIFSMSSIAFYLPSRFIV